MTPAQTFAQAALAFEYLAAAVVLLILVSSLDDVHLDARYWVRRLLVTLGLRMRPPVPTPQELRERPEQPMAIVVPAWQEREVIASMLENTLRRQEYRDYLVFVGTYPNDPATIAEVERMCALHPRIRRVQMPHPGPTCKADCLNHLVAALLEHERVTNRSFSAVVMHDSEDILHPLELKYFNGLLARFDMIQLPVVALERSWRRMVAGTYMDEFAESHAKEMLVRQHLCSSIPSAGVGTCFSRSAILALWRQSEHHPFRTDSLTEDYEVGLRLSALGLPSRFAVVSLGEGEAGAWAGLPSTGTRAESMLSVREYFPSGFRAAYRQRARWMLGIGLQSWGQLPLRDRPWPLVYMLLHDRKAVVTAFVPGVTYLVLAYMLLLQAGAGLAWWHPYEPAVFRAGSAWNTLLYVNGGLLSVRAAQRAYFTGWLYGWKQGLCAIPRMVVGNAVNFVAAARAWRLYLGHRLTGRALAWDKTAHEYPPGLLVPPPLPAPGVLPLRPPAPAGTAAVYATASARPDPRRAAAMRR